MYPVTTSQQKQTSHRSSIWRLATFGALAVAALMAAMVWVLEGQMQQAQVLRDQWQGTPQTAQQTRANTGRDAAVGQVGNLTAFTGGNSIMDASFGRP